MAGRLFPQVLGIYLFVVAVAPRLPLDLVPGYPLGLDDVAWLALMAFALAARPPSAALGLPLAFVVFVASASIAAGAAMRTLASIGPPLLTLAKLTQLFAVYVAVRALRPDLARTARYAAIAVLGVAAIAAVDAAGIGGELLDPYGRRIFDNAAYPGQTNHVAGFAALALPLLMAPTGRDRALRWTAGAAAVAIVFLSASRGALLATMAGGLIAARPRLALPFALTAVAGLALYAPARIRLSWIGDESYFLIDGVRRDAYGYPSIYTEGRFRALVAWIALDEFRRAPVLGTGLGSRHRVFYESAYVMIPAETGLVGVAATLWLALALVGTAGPPHRRAMFGLLAAFALLGFGAVTPVITRMAAPFWAYVAAFEEDR